MLGYFCFTLSIIIGAAFLVFICNDSDRRGRWPFWGFYLLAFVVDVLPVQLIWNALLLPFFTMTLRNKSMLSNFLTEDIRVLITKAEPEA